MTAPSLFSYARRGHRWKKMIPNEITRTNFNPVPSVQMSQEVIFVDRDVSLFYTPLSSSGFFESWAKM